MTERERSPDARTDAHDVRQAGGSPPGRAERLAAELRANLKRRKAASRAATPTRSKNALANGEPDDADA